jgi:hypothetical protein
MKCVTTELVGEDGFQAQTLGPAPEFGPDGMDPPRRTAPVVTSVLFVMPDGGLASEVLIRENLFRSLLNFYVPEVSSGSSGLGMTADSRPDWLPSTYVRSQHSIELVRSHAERQFRKYVQARRIILRQCWERDERILQLVAGEKHVRELTLNSGSVDLSLAQNTSSLDLGVGLSPVGLNKMLSQQLNRSGSARPELQTTTKREFHNDREGFYKRIAFWHVVSDLVVYRIAYENEPHVPAMSKRDEYRWTELGHVESADPTSSSTSCDVPVVRRSAAQTKRSAKRSVS